MSEPGGRNAATMRDVAAAAGVSTALVSIVFRGVPGASEETRARVLAVAEDLGYRPNRSASLIKLRRTKHLGVALQLHRAFHAELADGIQRAADAAGYRIVLAAVTPTHDEQRAVDTLLEYRCESLLLLGTDLPLAHLRRLAGQAPLVLVGRQVRLPDVDVVRSSEHRGQTLLVDHLVDLGHRRIVHVDGGDHPIAAQRRRGFLAAMRRRGLEDPATISGGPTEQDGVRAVEDLLRRDPRPTAVVAFNDHCALGVVEGLRRNGIRVPEDCSVTGYDNSVLAGLRAVDLTSVSQEAEALAEAAVKAAITRLESQSLEPGDTVLEPRLVVRGSTAPPG
jgi:DNA-binding LacI/PurR family transcriptional regulator